MSLTPSTTGAIQKKASRNDSLPFISHDPPNSMAFGIAVYKAHYQKVSKFDPYHTIKRRLYEKDTAFQLAGESRRFADAN